MKALFIYNQYSETDRQIFERAQAEMPTYVEFVEINSCSPELRKLIRATPAIIPVVDDLQGEYIKGDAVDGSLLATATLYKWLEQEESVIHGQNTKRLDGMIKVERQTAIDEYTLELIDGGVI